MATSSSIFSNEIVQNSVAKCCRSFEIEKHRRGRSGCVQILDTKTCQAQKACNTDSRTNYAVKYATARGLVIFFFPYNPAPPPIPTNPRPPHPERLISVHFGSVSVRFGFIWLRLPMAPFRVCSGSVSGPFRGVGWGRGGVGERGFCKGKNITVVAT